MQPDVVYALSRVSRDHDYTCTETSWTTFCTLCYAHILHKDNDAFIQQMKLIWPNISLEIMRDILECIASRVHEEKCFYNRMVYLSHVSES